MSIVATKRRNEGIKMEGETYTGLDLRSMKAFGSVWTNCVFVDCQFDMADLRTTKFTGCSFLRCSMRLVNFATSFVEDSGFVTCDLEQASFMGCFLRNVTFSECRLAYGETMFQDATCKQKVEFLGCNLHGSSLDFREVEPGSLKFDDCNLWGVKVGLACAFWNGTFDDRAIRQFVALIARVSQDQRLKDLAGDQYFVVCRAMDGRKGPVSTPTPVLECMEMEG